MDGLEIEYTDNSGEVLHLLEGATQAAAEIVGGMWETNAKGLVAPRGPRGNPWNGNEVTVLRNSITHQTQAGDHGPVVTVGSNLEIAPYVELGTGKFYDPPPEWLENHAKPKHGYGQAGIESWIYKDELDGKFKLGVPMEACPYLRPAMLEYVDDYRRVIEDELKTEQG